MPTLGGPRAVRAFRLDDDARNVLFQGQCAALAVAVADRTGWGVCILFNNPDAASIADSFGFDELVEAQRQRTLLVRRPELEPFLELDHFVVETPSGDWLDVRGLHTPASIRAGVVERSDGPISEIRVTGAQARAYADAVMLPQAYEVAKSLVGELMRQAFGEGGPRTGPAASPPGGDTHVEGAHALAGA